jgi:tetratricopeptide (TPR) repeat protein
MSRSPSTAPLGSEVSKLLDRGLVKYALGYRDEAIELWKKALDEAPRNRRAQDYLKSVGALLPPGEDQDIHTSTAEIVPVVGDLDSIDSRSPAESLVPPFTAEVAAYAEADARSTDDLDVEPMVPDVEILLRDAREDEAAGDFEGALRHAEEALKRDPEQEEAQELASSIRKRLAARYREELEPVGRVPFLRATDASILELSLDPIGGFLISQIDGEITIEELLTILGTFDEFRVLSSLHFFLENGIIELR